MKEIYYKLLNIINFYGFPGSSAGKESTCNVGDLGWEDPLEEGMAIHSSILAWRIPTDRGAWWDIIHGITKSRMRLSTARHIDGVEVVLYGEILLLN